MNPAENTACVAVVQAIGVNASHKYQPGARQ
jgi:hypothetical protein